MPSTTAFGLPYPSGTDPPNGPSQLQALADAVADQLAGGIRTSGAAKTAAAQNVTSGTAASLGTPDKVSGVVVPTNGLLCMTYEAKLSVGASTTLEATLYLNGSLVGAPLVNATDNLRIATKGSGAGSGGAIPLETTPFGLQIGVFVFAPSIAPAGTYEVEFKYARTIGSGTAQVSNRQLNVWSIGATRS